MRKVEYVDKMEVEWDAFTREMKQEANVRTVAFFHRFIYSNLSLRRYPTNSKPMMILNEISNEISKKQMN